MLSDRRNRPQARTFVPIPLLCIGSSSLACRDSIMCDSVPGIQSKALVLGPGIAGLFIQGIETGLVLAQFFRWFSARDGKGGYCVPIIVIFVTVVGLVQSGIYFASAWTRYVQQFGIWPTQTSPSWAESFHPIPTLVISVPVQALMIRRCYNLSGKSMFIITPLVSLLVASIVTSLWSIVLLIKFLTAVSVMEHLQVHPSQKIKSPTHWTYAMSVLLPSVLDVVLTSIVLYHLNGTKKQVYTAHIRKQISSLVNIAWQSALPPTVCAICLSVLYIQYCITGYESKSQFWQTVIQAMIGKLYVLSLFYMINAIPPQQPNEPSTRFITTLTEQIEAVNTQMWDARVEGDAASDIVFTGCDESTKESTAVECDV
ncbi:hypothetical protein EI94DRAFT_241219 [Lactarius quietus]|nr:hypothetical protein EI94DRAFT_241219 [Lactarius quietus]